MEYIVEYRAILKENKSGGRASNTSDSGAQPRPGGEFFLFRQPFPTLNTSVARWAPPPTEHNQ